MGTLRLVAYCESTEFGGAERSLELLLGGLDPATDVAILAVDAEVAGRLAAARPGTAVHLVPPAPSKRSVGPILARVRVLGRLRPDIFHASLQTPWSCQSGLLAAMLVPGVHVVAVEHLPLPSRSPRQRRFKRAMSRRLAAHVAVGERAARLVEEYTGVPAGSVRSVHNGVPDEGRRAHGSGAPRPVVGSIGRLVPEKGFDLLVRAIAAVPGVDAIIVGEGPERPHLERLLAELALRDRVVLRGAVVDARRHLPEFDVFALPSRHEGFPLAIVEAMLAGLPVLAADVGSIREAVLDGETGVLVAPEDLHALTAALRRLVTDGDERSRMAEAGRRLAQERFTDKAMVAAYEALYAEVLR